MENPMEKELSETDYDGESSICTDDYNIIEADALTEDCLFKYISYEAQDLLVAKIFQIEAENCIACVSKLDHGHVCFDKFKGLISDWTFTLRYADDAVYCLADEKKITSRQACLLKKLIERNAIHISYSEILKWKTTRPN